jgi:cation transport ATPase
MDNEDGTKRELIEEVEELRQRVTELEEIESERERVELEKVESQRKRNRSIALLLAMLPVLLGMIIFMINRSYFMQFFNPETRSCGLPLLLTTIVFTIAAYPALRKSFSVIESGEQPAGLFLTALVIIVLIIPAILILVLGPAAMIVLSSS